MQQALDNKTLSRLEAAVTKSQYVANGQKLKVVSKVNPEIKGGLIVEIGDRTIDLAAIEVPVLVFAGNTDGIAPLPSVRAVVPLLTGSREVRFEIVPGGHLGMLTGRAAR